MNNIDERKLLPIIRNAVSGQDGYRQQFVDAIQPFFDAFLASGLEKDERKGWTFDLTFFNMSLADKEPFRSALLSTSSDWAFFPESKDDCTYVIPGQGLIKIHLHSFLWNYGA